MFDRLTAAAGAVGRFDRFEELPQLDALGDSDGDADADRCRCDPDVVERPDADRAALRVDADACPGRGDLAASPGCRATVVGVLERRDVDAVATRAGGLERTYRDAAAGLLVAAGRFAETVAFHDEALADRARRDPLGAARAAAGRAGVVARIAAETGLVAGADRVDGYDEALRPAVAPTLARERVDAAPPPGAQLRTTRDLETGASVRIYDTPSGPIYHLRPPFRDLSPEAVETLAAAETRLARGAVEGGDRAPGRAVRAVADDDAPTRALTRVLRRHTRGYGVLEDLFADPLVSDVFATAPVEATPIRVAVDGERLRTNVRLTEDGAAALASRLRRTSGSGFSRAAPTLDAVIERDDRRIRVAGVTAPASDGFGFAFRAHSDGAFTLPALVANDTLTPPAAALLSLAVERGAAVLVAGARGAGKTTLLGSLLFELPAATRTVLIEDTPELPVAGLRTAGRDVQRLHVDGGDGPEPTPAEALRTALRLGEGALAVGEVRGEEAAALYEAMRVGAASSAVLGTIHGKGGDAVRERVVSDLGVSASSFAATDLVVTCADAPAGKRLARIEEVRATDEGVGFRTLFERDGDGLVAAGPIDRGNSRLLADLARPGEPYAAVRDALADRATTLADLAETDRTRPADLAVAYAADGSGGRAPAAEPAVERGDAQ